MSLNQEPIEVARSPFSEAMEMFRKNHAAVAGLVILILIVLGGIFGPFIYQGDPFEMVWAPFRHRVKKDTCWVQTI
jgi:peptide/nickel transport system permease protein